MRAVSYENKSTSERKGIRKDIRVVVLNLVNYGDTISTSDRHSPPGKRTILQPVPRETVSTCEGEWKFETCGSESPEFDLVFIKNFLT